MDFEKFKQIALEYKIPLLLLCGGVVFIVIGLILVVKTYTNTPPVEFQQKSASESAQIITIRVDIQGAVIHPGVYEFSSGSRVSDALEKVGGLTKQADETWISKNLNRAAKLIDGGKIYIPKIGEEGMSNTSNVSYNSNANTSSGKSGNLLGVTIGLININSASLAELDTLSGVGAVTAQKIIDGRPYGSVDDLRNKKVVGAALFEKIKDKLTI